MKLLSNEKNIALCISGQFMLVFLMVSAFLAGFAVHKCRNMAAPADIKSLTEGEWSALYEEVFNKSLHIHDPSKDGWGSLNYALFHEGNEGVLIGDDDWLFTTEEFELQQQWKENYRYNTDFILAVRSYLKAAGTELLVVPVPSKARIYEDKLGRYDYPEYKRGIYADFVGNMKASGIPVVDLLNAFKKNSAAETLFVKTDTHWSPEGSHLAARMIGEYVEKSLSRIPYQKVEFVTHMEGEVFHKGDLLRYVPMGSWEKVPGFDGVRLAKLETSKAAEEQAESQNVLFSDETPPITLVGTSYSANPAWNFEGFLKESLQSDILNAADEGLGPFETMKKYLGNKAYKTAPPKILIWEIPERYLSFSYDLKSDFYNKES